jgi:hypothetical protein
MLYFFFARGLFPPGFNLLWIVASTVEDITFHVFAAPPHRVWWYTLSENQGKLVEAMRTIPGQLFTISARFFTSAPIFFVTDQP